MKMPPDLESLKKSPELLKKEINELECNMSIDNARLLEVRAVCNKIRDLQGSIKTAYDTYQSPSLIDVRRSTGQEADPVTKHFTSLKIYIILCANAMRCWIGLKMIYRKKSKILSSEPLSEPATLWETAGKNAQNG